MVQEHPKAFISHASEDQSRFVTDFSRRLFGKGVEAWYSKWEMHPGDRLIERIFDQGIGEADTLIVILSTNSVGKLWVREEIDAAFVRRVERKLRRIIPVVIDDCEVPVALQSTLRVRIRDLESYESELEQIVSSIFGLSEKPELGSLPAHTQAPYVGIPHLARTDNIILRLACEDATESGDFASSPNRIWQRAETLGISRQDFDDGLVMLNKYGYIKGFIGGGRIIAFTITLHGFHEYAKAYIPELNSILTAVAARIVNDGMTNSGEIHRSLDEPKVIVEYAIQFFENQGWISAAAPIGNDLIVVDVSPELRRRLMG